MKKPFQFVLRQGVHSRQAHVKIPEGTFEEEIGREGFFGAATHLYRQNPPTDWVAIEGDCRPQAWDFNRFDPKEPWACKRFLYNKQTSLSLVHSKGNDPWYLRNADGDEVQFIHDGSG